MKRKINLSYVFGTIMILLGMILLLAKDVVSIVAGISFLFIAIIIYPTFNYICKWSNKKFSIGRKIVLGIGTFLIAAVLTAPDKITYAQVYTYIVSVLAFWTIMFVTSKDKDIKIEEISEKKEYVIVRKENNDVSSNNKVVENFEEIEYEVPDITVVKDDKSKAFVDFLNKMKLKDEVMIPIGNNKNEFMIESLSKMPNMLIGGTVMSGKTAYINSIICSILLTKKPNEIKMIIFDSKKVDYSVYNGIPHLMMPVINDSKKLDMALQKVSIEIRRRMELLNQANVKNITRYNNMITDEYRKVPDILVIIDDLTNLNGLEEINYGIEDISLNGWNVNVYMIVSANHPSARVLSTLSKSNFPSRLSFKVTNAQASQNIINDVGAEKLTGLGNALYISRMINKPMKVSVPYIADEDIKNIVNKWTLKGSTVYSINDIEVGNKEEYNDPLYDNVVEFVVKTGNVSASMLQRKFKLGYNRAARIIDLLEERGIVGPSNGSKPREVLVKLDEN